MLPDKALLAGQLASHDPADNDLLLRQIFDYQTVQLTSGTHCRRLDFAATNHFICYRENVGADLHSFGSLRGDRVGIAIPRNNNLGFRFWNRDVTQQQLALAKSGSELQIHQNSGLDLVALVWSKSLISELQANPFVTYATAHQLDRMLSGSNTDTYLRTTAASCRAWGDFFAAQLDLFQSHSNTLSAERFNSLATGTLLSIADETNFEVVEKMSRRSAWELVSRAIDLDADNLQMPCIIPVLCGELGCSRRKLEIAFGQVIGISPLKYLNKLRMNSVYRELISGDPQADTVTAIAAKYGFTELGRFAGNYKKIFSESPLQTLQASRQPNEINFSTTEQLRHITPF